MATIKVCDLCGGWMDNPMSAKKWKSYVIYVPYHDESGKGKEKIDAHDECIRELLRAVRERREKCRH